MKVRWSGWAFQFAASAAVLVSVAQLRAAPPEEAEVAVRIASIVRTTLCERVTVYGTIEPAPLRPDAPAAQAVLAAPVDTRVESVEVTEGQTVRRDQRLVRADPRTADAAVERARAEHEAAQAALARQQRLAEQEATSERQLLEARERAAVAEQALRAALAARSLLDVTSPIDGVVTRVWARAGETVLAGQPLVKVMDPNRLVMAAAAPAAVAGRLQPGQRGVVEAGGNAVTGEVEYVAGEAASGTDMVEVRIRLPPSTGLRAGQFARARVVVAERRDCLAVPVESVYTDHEGVSEIRLVSEDGRARRVEVRRGLRDGNLVEVAADGLAAGASVVTVGAYALPDGARVRVAPASTEPVGR